MKNESIYDAIRTMRSRVESAVVFSEDYENSSGGVYVPHDRLDQFRESALIKHHQWQDEFTQALTVLDELRYPVSLECRNISVPLQPLNLGNPQICFSRVPREQEELNGRQYDKVWVLGSAPTLWGKHPADAALLESFEIFDSRSDVWQIAGLFCDRVVRQWKSALEALRAIEQRLYEAETNQSISCSDSVYVRVLCKELDCVSKTLNKYARLAGVKPPGQGQRDRSYSAIEARRILEAITRGAGSGLAIRARELLEKMDLKSKAGN